MAEPVGDLVVDLSLDAARFDEQMARVRRHFSGTESDAKKTAAVVEQSLSRQALAAQKAGISVGQYKAAMRMLPAQFTDVATQLAGGQSPWLILLQQGGQVKDSFGGMIPMFRGLAGAITLPMVGATSLAVATGALAYAWYQGNSTLSDFNKTLVLSGNQAGLTADRILALSRAGQAAGLTFNQTSESLTALVNAGVRGGEQFEAISQSVARFSSASGVEVDKVAEAFGKLTTDPTSGLTAMARQFHNVTAEQIAYVAQLQRSGDEAGALQAANEAATKGFDDQTRRLKENMGTLETWADRTARAFKSMWDSVLDIGRPDTAREMLEKAEKAFDEADKKWQWYQSRSHRRGKTSAFLANLRGAWEDRANAQLGLSAATLQADLEKAREMAAKDWAESEASRLKYTEEAQKAYERLQTPLEKYTARQEELNKALKDGKILQADYNTLMAAAKKDYEATLKKPKQSGVKVSAGDRQEDSAHAALLTLQAELRTLERHAGANEKISQQRRDLWKAESQFAVLEEPEAYFRMSPEDWLQAEMQGEIVALVHSHPGGLPWLSEADRRLQVQSDLPWWLVCRGTIHKFRCVPHLTGRRFEHGVTDCYTLFRDAYHLAGIEMPDFHREDDWWRNGQNLYLDNLEATGLYQVPLSAAQPGDVLLCCFGSSVPNHAAIYCGDGELLHHIPEQLSKRERYTDKWQRRTHSLWRHRAWRASAFTGIYNDLAAASTFV
ncbi:phage tail tape measure protein [Escherichia coli]|nr:phage tail tape measure protein [Escherichia coli]